MYIILRCLLKLTFSLYSCISSYKHLTQHYNIVFGLCDASEPAVISLSHSLLQNPCLETIKSLGHDENYAISLFLELREHRFSGLYVYSALNLKVCFIMESFLQETTLKILSVQVIITFHMTIH